MTQLSWVDTVLHTSLWRPRKPFKLQISTAIEMIFKTITNKLVPFYTDIYSLNLHQIKQLNLSHFITKNKLLLNPCVSNIQLSTRSKQNWLKLPNNVEIIPNLQSIGLTLLTLLLRSLHSICLVHLSTVLLNLLSAAWRIVMVPKESLYACTRLQRDIYFSRNQSC